MIAVGLIQFVILVFALLRAKGLAVMLGPEGVGIIGTMDQLVITLTQVAAFGIPFAAMKFLSAAHSTSEELFRDCFTAFARVMLGLSALVTLLGIAVALFAPGLLSGFAEYRDVVLVAMLSVPPTMMTILLAHTLASAQMPRGAALYNLAFAASMALAGLAGAWAAGITGFYIGAGAAGGLTILVVMVWMSRRLGLSALRPGVSIRHELTRRPNVIRTALSASLVLVSFSVTMLIVRYAVIGALGEAPSGLLQAALSLALSLGSILATMNGLYLSPSLNRTDPEDAKFRKATRFASRVALLLVASAVPGAVLPALGLTILFTAEFVPAAMALILCLIWQCTFQLRSVYLQLLVGVDRPLAAAVAALIALAATSASVFGLVGSWGILAAPAALIIGEVLAIGFMVTRLVRFARMPVPWGVLARFLWAGAAIGGAGLVFDPTVILPGPADFALRLGYAVAALLLTWITMPADLTLRASIGALRPRLPGRAGGTGGGH